MKFYEKLKEERFEARFGTIYEGLNLNSKIALSYTSFFLFRRFLFAITAIFCRNWP